MIYLKIHDAITMLAETRKLYGKAVQENFLRKPYRKTSQDISTINLYKKTLQENFTRKLYKKTF